MLGQCWAVSNFALKHVRIAEGDSVAQYWLNLGSQQSAIDIGSAFKFTDLQTELGPVSALY